MNVLVLGGTRFVGRAFVEAALSNAHTLTMFNRGLSDPAAFPETRRVAGDRSSREDVAPLEGAWDCVVDVSGYRPDQLRPFLDLAGASVVHYLYVSTVSVYAEPMPPGAAEDAPMLSVGEDIAAGDPRAYGGLKALCELLLRDRLGERLTVVRPTFVIGPHDYTDRFTWWVRRIAHGGRMAVPPNLGQHLQLIDVRDLAAFMVRIVEGRVPGTFNAVGPERPISMAAMIEAVAEAVGTVVVPVPVDARSARALAFPLYIGDEDDGGLQVSGAAARVHGLTLRPLAASVHDILDWDRERGLPPLRSGPSLEAELGSLAALT